MTSSARPLSAAACSVVLALIAPMALLFGLAASALSSCCGSPDPANESYAAVGLLFGSGLVVASCCLWSGSSRQLLLAALAVPAAVCTLASVTGSPDFTGPALLGLLVAGSVAYGCRTASWRAWFARE